MRNLILCAAIAVCSCFAQNVDYFNLFSNSDCMESGMNCINSTFRITCKADGNGGFLNLGEYDCSLSKQVCCKGHCQDPDEDCSDDNNNNPDLQFICSESGTFPDFKECKTYHVCNGTELQYSADCACNPYDLTMEMCGAPPCMGCPPSNVDYCNDASLVGLMQPYPPMTTDSSSFYICINSTAYTMGKCPDEETLNDQNQCMPDCSKNPGPFIDPNDCHSYQFCDSNSMLQSAKCPEGEAYDDSSKLCLPSKEVPGCELKGTPTTSTATAPESTSTSTSPSSSITPDSTSSSTMSSTPTTSTTSTTGPSNCPFQCEIPGNYSDSRSCHLYVSCSSSLNATCHDCGSDNVYSPFYRQCVVGIC